jgi:hypothetical protein
MGILKGEIIFKKKKRKEGEDGGILISLKMYAW